MKHFIAGDVPSSKNSKQKTKSGAIISSKATQNYIKSTIDSYIEVAKAFQEYAVKHDLKPPYCFTLEFIRETKRTFDYNNMSQIVQDLLIQATYIFWLSENLPLLLANNEKVYIKKTSKGILTETLLDIPKTLKALKKMKTIDLERIYKHVVCIPKYRFSEIRLLDDNADYFIPYFIKYRYDKKTAGVNLYFGKVDFE